MTALYALLGGALLGAGFLASALWPLAFVGAAFFIAALERSRSARGAFGIGLLAGCVLLGCAYGPIFWQTLPLDWLGVFPRWSQIAVVAVSWALTAAGAALASGLFALAYRALRTDSWRDVVFAGALWPLAEWASAWIFSAQNYGPGAILAPHFSLGFVGNQLAGDAALLQLAWLGGVYALSALVFVVGVALYRAIASPRERAATAAFLALGVAACVLAHVVLAGIDARRGEPLRIALVGMQEEPVLMPTDEQRDAHFAYLRDALKEAGDAEIVLLPENAELMPELRRSARDPRAELTALLGGRTPVLVDSQTVYTKEGAGAGLEYYDLASGSSQRSGKHFLLPDGEYVPYLYQVVIGSVGFADALHTISAQRTYVPGEPALADVRGARVGGLFCDETLSPVLYAALAREGASVFLNTASHSWFHGSRAVEAQLQNAAKVRAVESRRWYAQASDAVPSYALDPYGRVAAQSPRGRAGVLQVVVYPRNSITPYLVVGNWMPLILLGVVWILAYRKKKDAIMST